MQHKTLSNLKIHSENINTARKAVIDIMPKNTKKIMLIEEGEIANKTIWYWIGSEMKHDKSISGID
jgi:hypothetical protein